MAPTLYYMVESPPCRAVMILAKYLNIDLNLKSLNLLTGEHLSEEFKKINPQHKVPTLVDGDFILSESRAIMSYLVQTYSPDSKLFPNDTKAQAKINQWLYFDSAVLYPALSYFILPLLAYNHHPNTMIKPNVVMAFKTLDDHLETHKYIANNTLSLADISILASISFADTIEELNEDLFSFASITEWRERVQNELGCYKEVTEQAVENSRKFFDEKRKGIEQQEKSA